MAHNEHESTNEPLSLTPEMGYPRFHVDSVAERVDFDDSAFEAFQTKRRKLGTAATVLESLQAVELPGTRVFEPTHY